MSTIWLVTKQYKASYSGDTAEQPIRAFATEQEAEQFVDRIDRSKGGVYDWVEIPFGEPAEPGAEASE